MDGDPTEFARACVAAGIKPTYHPPWYDLPYVDIFQSITPDVLHQLYQGLVKHLVAWLVSAFGASEIDARCRRMLPCHGTRLFTKGISKLSRVTGQEHRDMCRVLLGLIVDLRLPDGASPTRLVKAVRQSEHLTKWRKLSSNFTGTNPFLSISESELSSTSPSSIMLVNTGSLLSALIPPITIAPRRQNDCILIMRKMLTRLRSIKRSLLSSAAYSLSQAQYHGGPCLGYRGREGYKQAPS